MAEAISYLLYRCRWWPGW